MARSNRLFFYFLLLAVGYLSYLLVRPYLGTIVFALVIVMMFVPTYEQLILLTRGRHSLAMGLTLAIVLLLILIPTAVLISIAASQVPLFVSDARAFIEQSVSAGGDSVSLADGSLSLEAALNWGNSLLAQIPFVDYQLTNESVVDGFEAIWQPVTGFSADLLVTLGTSSLGIITSAIIFLSVVSALFPSWRYVVELILDLSPLDDELDMRYIQRVTSMTSSMVRGVFVIAIAQGLGNAFFLWLAGVPYLAFFAVISIILCLLPIGASLVALPVGIVLLLTGNYWQAALVIAGYVLVVSNIDSLIRPRLVSKDAQLNPALVIIGAFGGLSLFGFFGVIYGPVIMILLVTTIEIYLEHYQLDQDNDGILPELGQGLDSAESEAALAANTIELDTDGPNIVDLSPPS